MIQTPANYLPVQQAAVTQQIQQNPAPVVGPASYSAVRIDIQKPEVVAGSAPTTPSTQDPVYGMPYNPIYSYPQPQQPQQAN